MMHIMYRSHCSTRWIWSMYDRFHLNSKTYIISIWLKIMKGTRVYSLLITPFQFYLILPCFSRVALPSPPIEVKVSDVTSTSVKLSWSHPNPDDIQYYTISHKPRSASQSPGVISGVVTMYYTIRPLSPYTQYEFTISAVNGFGHGPPSPPIVATTGETGKLPSFRVSFSR